MPKIVKLDDKTREQIKTLSGMGIPHEQICSLMDITKPTLYKHFKDELVIGKATANTQVAKNLYKIATGESRQALTACIFWLKTQCGWTETERIEIGTESEEDAKFRRVIDTVRAIRLEEKEISKSD